MSPTLTPTRAAAKLLERDDMRLLGIERTSRLGRAYNRRRGRESLRRREEALEGHLAMLDGHRDGGRELEDGYAVDRSRSLPHLDRLLEEMELVISERGGRRLEDYGKPFLQNILPEHAEESYPSILDFITSPEVLAPVARHTGFVPCLSGALPRGVRLMESSTKFDPQPDGPWRSSQLWHIDYHSTPTIYVIVALREIAPGDGPLHFLGESASRRAAEALRYGARGEPYRVTDDRIDPLIDADEVKRFTGPAGSVLVIDSSRCFHFGSRRPANARYHMQYAYISPVRNDFTRLLRAERRHPTSADDPTARRLALERDFAG